MNIVVILPMNEKVVWVFMLLLVGWFLGYMHHYQATRPQAARLEQKVQALRGQINELKAKVTAVKEVNLRVTAYSNDPASINVPRWRDGKTATNKRVRRGYAAADWRLFPPGTRLYVPGYGEAVVEDRGGAITGNRLDLYVDSHGEALDWGNRMMRVYVLEKG